MKYLKKVIIIICVLVIAVVGYFILPTNTSDQVSAMTEKPEVVVDSGNLSTKVSWNKIDFADSYKVYRKLGVKGKYRLIGETEDTTFTDVYVDSAKTAKEKEYLCAGVFVDPSINPYIYTVKACFNNGDEETYGEYLKDGAFHIETPSIVRVDKSDNKTATVEWSILKNAKGYLIYSGYKDKDGLHWHKLAEVEQGAGVRQKKNVTVNTKDKYFTVKARFEKEGKTVYSDYDKGFTIENKKFQNKNILFIGDSITFGSPYKGKNTVEVFSYPWRVQQLTGAKIYNPSIPGATYAYKNDKSRDRLVEDVAVPINDGRTPYKAIHNNKQTYKDFDVVIMAAGTNDYSDNISLGNKDSNDRTEFNGALNEIMGYIKNASKERVKEGKKPIKIVFVDLFYSNRTHEYSKLTNRFITENDLGLTLADYQNNLNQMITKYKDEGYDIYQFHTNNFVDEDTCSKNTSDNLHMTRYTYTQIGNKLTSFMIDNEIMKD